VSLSKELSGAGRLVSAARALHGAVTQCGVDRELLLGFDERVQAVMVLGACGAAVEVCVHAGNGGVGVGA